MSIAAIRSIDPGAYTAHELHRAERSWGESNCYIDVWIEVLHALGCEPYACLPFVLTVDWEGDEFTFFKPPHEDLVELYGVDVQELNVYRPLIDHSCEFLRGGKLILTEADAYFLPDTAGTDYRTQHTKTTIGIQEIDREARVLGYFHNSGYHVLRDADFVSLFRLDAPPDPTFMPHFAEFVRTERVQRHPRSVLAQRSVSLLRKHLGRRPTQNPVSRFAAAFRDDVEKLKEQGLAAYHLYAFATIRQLGAAFELGALYLRWLAGSGESDLAEIAGDFDAISAGSKTLILKTARAVGAKKSVDLSPILADLESSWARGMERLARRYEV